MQPPPPSPAAAAPEAGRRHCPPLAGGARGPLLQQPPREGSASHPPQQAESLSAVSLDCNSHRSPPAGEDGTRRAMPLEGEGKACRGRPPPTSKGASAGNWARLGVDAAGFTRPSPTWGIRVTPFSGVTEPYANKVELAKLACCTAAAAAAQTRVFDFCQDTQGRRCASGPRGGDGTVTEVQKGTPNNPNAFFLSLSLSVPRRRRAAACRCSASFWPVSEGEEGGRSQAQSPDEGKMAAVGLGVLRALKRLCCVAVFLSQLYVLSGRGEKRGGGEAFPRLNKKTR